MLEHAPVHELDDLLLTSPTVQKNNGPAHIVEDLPTSAFSESIGESGESPIGESGGLPIGELGRLPIGERTPIGDLDKLPIGEFDEVPIFKSGEVLTSEHSKLPIGESAE